jgi:hypothetical protein
MQEIISSGILLPGIWFSNDIGMKNLAGEYSMAKRTGMWHRRYGQRKRSESCYIARSGDSASVYIVSNKICCKQGVTVYLKYNKSV